MNTKTENTKTDDKEESLPTIDSVAQRRIFTTLEDGLAYIESIREYEGADDVPFSLTGITIDEEGNYQVDEDVWPDGTEIMVATLSIKATKTVDDETVNYQKTVGVVMHPIPSLDALIADDKGREMVVSVLRKELNHRAVRPIRPTSTRKECDWSLASEMPRTIAEYAESQKGGQSAGLEAFAKHYQRMSKRMGKRVQQWQKAKINKTDLQRALSNKGFADYFYPQLEKADAFVLFLNALIQQAEKDGMETALLREWLATRAEQQWQPDEDDNDDDDLLPDLGSLLADDEDDEEDAGDDDSEADADDDTAKE